MAYPFNRLSSGLSSPTQWRDVMSLHINTKYCRATVTPTASKLIVRIGSKGPEELSRTARLEFEYSASAATQDYLSVALAAKAGPLGTSDYRITLEAVPLLDGRSFLRLRYSYAFGLMGKLAMQTYLATVGSDKVGFTVVAQRPDGEPEYIGGVRGVVERNTMRYYLAVDSFLESMPTPPAAQFEQRLHSWFAATERYARQLHEGNLEAYLAMKRAEQVREQEDD